MDAKPTNPQTPRTSNTSESFHKQSSTKRVFLGMSGGVDSSVSAILLKEQGYDVIGIYMKNWSKDLPGMKCPWAEDLADAKRVAVQLDLNFEVWDFEQAYKQEVVDYMLAEFQKGRTPNPDVICNELIKFKLFYDQAISRGADYIATGHYARTGVIAPQIATRTTASPTVASNAILDSASTTLLRARDENKDQTYFLYRMSDIATARTLFPVGNLTKPEVKALAQKHGLDVATKKESMGVCFVGEVGMKDFLKEYLDTQPGEIREREADTILGYHDGAIFYTIGQRHGLYLGGGLPYYVVAKDLAHNIVYVSKNLNHSDLWTRELPLEDLHLRNGLTLDDLTRIPNLQVRLRHRAPLLSVKAQVTPNAQSKFTNTNTSLAQSVNPPASASILALLFSDPIKRPAPGQSAVLYSGETCLGGGIVTE